MIILVKNQCTSPDKKGVMLCYDSTMEYRLFFLNEEMFYLKFEQKLFCSPIFLPYILGLICMFAKCQKDSKKKLECSS